MPDGHAAGTLPEPETRTLFSYGGTTGCASVLVRARTELDAQGMAMHAALCQLALARSTGDRRAAERAERKLQPLGIRSSARMLSLWLPGLSALPA